MADGGNLLIVIALLPFLGALVPGIMIRAGRTACASFTAAPTALALAILLVLAPSVMRGEVITAHVEWLPQLGLSASFFLDGLGLLFAGMILGVGLLITLYARFYLSGEDPMGQFYTYLLLFQGAMLGIVLSDNILLLLVFWELTSLSSFLLIGYWKHLPEGRQGARMALAVTGAGGLALIGGMLILGNIAGSYNLTDILQQGDVDPRVRLVSARADPDPPRRVHEVGAVPVPLLASARDGRADAGVGLPAFGHDGEGGRVPDGPHVARARGHRRLVLHRRHHGPGHDGDGRAIALFKDDLKALLAFSTVSHLGLLTMLLGFGTEIAAVVAVFHIINHLTFKAALFMTAGIIDHETHTRDIKRLGGLRHLMPITFLIGTVAALSMAGMIFFNGFLSKEMMLEEAAHTTWAGSNWAVPVLATLGSLLSAAYSFRFIGHVFLGPVRDDYPIRPTIRPSDCGRRPRFSLVFVILIGLLPAAIVGPLVAVAGGAVIGEAPLPYYSLRIWHGFTPGALHVDHRRGRAAFSSSGCTARSTGSGSPRRGPRRSASSTVSSRAMVGHVAPDHGCGAQRRHQPLPRDLRRELRRWRSARFAWSGGGLTPPTRELMPVPPVIAAGWLLLVAGAIGVVLLHRQRFIALVVVSIIGLMVSATLRLPLGARPRAHPDCGRDGDDHAPPARAALPAEGHAGGKQRGAAPSRRRNRGRRGRGRRRRGPRLPDARHRDDIGLPHRQLLRRAAGAPTSST
jgi:multicomponent K+:H+ antiporter subunit A